MANTAPDVNLDEVLAALDGDSQAYLRALIVGAGQGLAGRGQDLGKMLAASGPINRDLDKLITEVAKRDENLKRLVHNLATLTGRSASRTRTSRAWSTRRTTRSQAIGEQDPDVQQRDGAPARGAERDARRALAAAKEFGDELGPGVQLAAAVRAQPARAERGDDEPGQRLRRR